MNEDAIDRITAAFLRIANKIGELNRHRLDFGTGECLTPSEIHMLAAIANGWNTVTRLGRELGVTKGAVSQLIGRLHRKGYVRKEDGGTGKTVSLSLTGRGEAACRGHAALHRVMDREMAGVIGEYPPEWRATFESLLDELEKHVDRYRELGTAPDEEALLRSAKRGPGADRKGKNRLRNGGKEK